MIALLAEKRGDIDELCRRYRVNRLELFGSSFDGDFDQEKSDVDFLVEFESTLPK
jgi:predicted nucleotidyltransferase